MLTLIYWAACVAGCYFCAKSTTAIYKKQIKV